MQTFKRFEKSHRTFNLGASDIDDASEWLVDKLEAAGVDKADRLRLRLLFEEALINMADHFGVEQEVTASLNRRWGSYRLRLVGVGNRFNPLRSETETDVEQDGWATSLFSVINMRVQYSYSQGANVLRMSLARTTWNPVLKIILAIAIGVVVGIVGNLLIPDAAQESFTGAVLDPIANMWVRLLQTISAPIIFLTALTATFDTKRVADFGGSRVGTVARYFGISVLVTIFAMACAIPFFFSEIEITNPNAELVSSGLDLVLQIVPGNLVQPFSEANTPQLLLIAIVIGYLLASMQPQTGELLTIIQQLNMLGLAVAKQACALVPFFVGLLLCLRIWTHDTDQLGTIWLPLVLAAVISVLVFIGVLLVVSARLRVNPVLLARKLSGPFWEALKRGTLDFAAIDDLADSCKRLLGINGEFARAILPQGLFLYMPTSAIGICVFVLFAARAQQVPVDQLWLISATMLSVVLAVATPPMTGANLLSFVMAFVYLGISSDAFLDVMVFDIIFGVLCIAFDQAMLQIETINQAKRMGFLNEEVLRAPLP